MGKPDIGPVLEKYGVRVRSRLGYVKVKCPFHKDDNPSASVRDNRLHCFSCGFDGDAIDVIQQMEGVGYADAKRLAEEITGTGGDEVRGRNSDSPGLFGRPGNNKGDGGRVAPWGGLFT